jgi:hypothetical protein
VGDGDVTEESGYAFPLYHRVGKAVQPAITSKYWLLIVIGIAILLYLPLLFSGFYADDLGHRMAFSPDAAARLGWTQGMKPAWWNLYGFSTHAESYFDMLRNQGFFYPWWASDKISVSFLRPLASATLALDFSLWPNTPLPIHLHSLLWFLLLIVLIFHLYKRLTGSITVAGLGILLIVLDDIFASPAGWISNRHSLIAMVFGVLCLMLYDRGVRQKRWGLIGGSYALLAVALLASEMGLVTFAYLFAHMLILDDDKWLNRILRIAPFVIIIVVWRAIYSALGYGVHGSTLYVDPVASPLQFARAMVTRLPISLFTAVGLPIASVEIASTPRATGVIAIVCAILVVLYAAITFPVLKRHRLAAFWLIGLLCALVPVSAGVPGSRNLVYVSLGLMGLVSQLFIDVARMEKSDLTGFSRALLKAHVPVLVILYMIISPIIVLTQSNVWQTTTAVQRRPVNFGDDPALADQNVYIVNPPGVAEYIIGTFWRAFGNEPIPASINYLSPGFTPVTIQRVDDRTIRVTPESGYAPPPGLVEDPASGTLLPTSETNVYRNVDRSFFYDPNYLTEVGQTVTLSEFTAEVAKMTDDGRIAEAIFTFAQPLESDRYRWLVWDADSQSYRTVEMPPVGESRVYP